MLADFREILREASAASGLDEALDIVVTRIKDSLSADACAVYLIDDEGDQYLLTASVGLSLSSISNLRSDPQIGLLGLVGERRELVVVENASTHPQYSPSRGTGEDQFDTFLGIPLIHHHHVLGILVAWKKNSGGFETDEMTFFVTIAAQLARVVHEAAAVDEVTRLIRGGRKESAFILGTSAAGGVAVGTASLLEPLAKLDQVPDRHDRDSAAEEAAFRSAVAAVRRELESSRTRLAGVLLGEVRALFDVYVMLLDDDVLVAGSIERIRKGSWAPAALRDTIAQHSRVFDQMEDPYLRARADDIRDLGQQILSHLRSESEESRRYPDRCILVGDAVGITDIAAVPSGQLAGIVCTQGSVLSHAAVLAHALGIPAVVSLASLPIGLIEGCMTVVDGDFGRIYVNPSQLEIDEYEGKISAQRELSDQLASFHQLPAQTKDDVLIPLYANVGLAGDTEAARQSAAEGVGLVRTEYQFLLSDAFPIEDELFQSYRQMLRVFTPRPVTIRTLDVGGDKILSYFPIAESNPFLGCRGIRFSLEHPEIFLIQLRAMLRANAGLGNLQVLFPMISRVDELDQALGLLARAHSELLEEGKASAAPKVGVMIEVPSAVFLTKALADRAEFLSIGTNDLAQYTLAVDRTNSQVTTPYDTFHPAVLHAVQSVILDAHDRSTPVSVCGEMAAEAAGAIILLGMGIDSLSMSPAALSRVKFVIRSFTAERARALAEEALKLESGEEVFSLLSCALETAGVPASDNWRWASDQIVTGALPPGSMFEL